MAIKNSVALTDLSGGQVPTNNVVISAIHFPQPTLNLNPDGTWNGTVTRLICYDLYTYRSKASVQNPQDTCVIGGVREYPNGWTREMTAQEYIDILANGMLAEVWLQTYLNAMVTGNNATIIDPYL